MNAHALAVLQFEETLGLVAGFASSPLGADRIRALRPSDAHAWIVEELRRVDQMAAFQLRAEDWMIPAIPDLRSALKTLAVEGSVWEGHTLRDARTLLAGADQTRRMIAQRADDYPLVAQIGARIVRLDRVEDAIERAIDDAGEVKDGASRELASLRREIRGARGRIIQKLEQYMASLPDRFRVSDASVTVREGRYVIPVRREGRAEIGGLVHDESATGGTLFVEPPVALELMNRLRELERAEAREVQRILRELTEHIRPHHAEMRETLDAMIELDALHGRARYALEYNGRKPEVAPRGTRGCTIVEAYHPLLQAGGEPVVPFSLTMGEDERTLLVSGPNTGGKTVLLKAMGLISALAQSGIIPPVGPGTRLPLFTDVFADIGDEQSIEASLSTFSAHLRNLREILEKSDADSLVLIDEMGSGTDPAEGGALAQAILVELTRRGTFTVATTHLGQLKLLASEERGVVNASLQFDSAELRPTYRLLKGIPGRSYGLAIARRLGFPGDLLERAESFQPQQERDAAQLLLALEENEKRAAAALAEAETARREALELRRKVEEREHVVGEREREAERRARQQARDILLSARQEVESAIRELREAASAGGAQFEEAVHAARRHVEDRARRQAEKTPERQPAKRAEGVTIEAGTRVRMEATGAEGTVVEVRDGRATVEAGGIRLQVRERDLVPIGPAPKAKPRVRSTWSAPDFEPSSEVDLRGLRAEEVETRLLPALDAAIQAALPSLRIIHGKGTGALREVVNDLLRADRRIATFRPGGVGEGGTGVTVVELG